MTKTKYDFDLFKEIYFKQVDNNELTTDGRAAQGTKKNTIDEYFKTTGLKMTDVTYSRYVTRARAERYPQTFNERTDEIIDESTTLMNEEDILVAVGLDPNEFQIKPSTINRWWLDRGDILERIRNGQLKVNFEKRKEEITTSTIEEILKNLINDRQDIDIKPRYTKTDSMYLIPLKDMHFGPNTYEDYINHQASIYRAIDSNDWDKVVFIIGSDLFQSNDTKGRTYNDTVVENTQYEITKRFKWARQFYVPLIMKALECSKEVVVMYEMGNHDRDISALFVQALAWEFEETEVQFIIEEHKPYQEIIYGNVWIGTHHGDIKSKPKTVAELFNKYFRTNIAEARYREILIGHLHHLWSEEHIGILVQGLSTASKDSPYDYIMGFAEGEKSFITRIYSKHGLEGMKVIHGREL